MAVVKKPSSTPRVVSKKDTTSKSVLTTRTVTVFEELTGVDVPNPQDGFVLVYDSSSGNFVLVDPDVVLSESVSDRDLPDDFITQLESELSLGQISVDTLDGGSFT